MKGFFFFILARYCLPIESAEIRRLFQPPRRVVGFDLSPLRQLQQPAAPYEPVRLESASIVPYEFMRDASSVHRSWACRGCECSLCLLFVFFFTPAALP